MKTPRTRIAQTIADKTLSGGDTSNLGHEVAAYLLSEHRVSELDSIMRDVQADRANSGIVEVIASSAHSLSPEVLQNIEKQVQSIYPSAKKIVVTAIRDEDIIGGVRLELPNQQLDLSVEAKLNKFKQLTTTGKE